MTRRLVLDEGSPFPTVSIELRDPDERDPFGGVVLPWAKAFSRDRCRARSYPGQPGMGPYFGRCELREHPVEVAHALERGFDTPRWVVLTVG